MSAKGQLFLGDFVVAVFIFAIVLAMLAVSWDTVMERYSSQSDVQEMELKAAWIADAMLTSGKPSGWENSNTSVIGLVDHDRTISPAKLAAFSAMDYNQSKRVMGVQGYEYFFSLPASNVTKGDRGGSTRAFARRVVMYNGVEYLEFMLWK
ncbi:MAG: hypothetical protein HYY37_02770 [Candidatus Aenigmarchaeota archaeon]|nr:hypothetical protein [Candidatus Aenigmarchaeota archaeon]